MQRTTIITNVWITSLALLSGCWGSSGPEVTAYTAMDSEFADPIYRQFTAASGIAVAVKGDTESTKTVGLAEDILQERARPRCDVFWNNEILNTLRLARAGLLDAYCPKAAADYPAQFRAADGAWHGFAARARVLLVNTRLLDAKSRPRTVGELSEPRWRGRVGMAKPLFGSTATHAACLFAVLGPERARRFFHQLKRNDVKILSGNKQVAMAVGSGQLAVGLTDTDDALGELDKAMPVVIVYPDQGDQGLGTLFIPNTLAIIKGCPHPEAARRLVDYLLAPAVEAQLATGPAGQIPLNATVKVKTRVETPRTVRAMKVDFAKAAALWDDVAKFLRDEFTGG
jgi:iron(III) transport system substrate-binding protein